MQLAVESSRGIWCLHDSDIVEIFNDNHSATKKVDDFSDYYSVSRGRDKVLLPQLYNIYGVYIMRTEIGGISNGKKGSIAFC